MVCPDFARRCQCQCTPPLGLTFGCFPLCGGLCEFHVLGVRGLCGFAVFRVTLAAALGLGVRRQHLATVSVVATLGTTAYLVD